MAYPVLTLKQGKEANLGFHHPWVYSGALEKIPPDVAHGDLVWVADRNNRIIGTGAYSAHSMIAVRAFAFGQVDIDAGWIRDAIFQGNARRELLGYGPRTQTTGYRVVFAESDQLPGLIIDRYEDVFVVQISTAGMEKLKPLVINAINELFSPRAIVERSDLAVRAEERLDEFTGVVSGKIDAGGDRNNVRVEFLEHGLKFLAPVLSGQKTGFFLDQKELRTRIQILANGRRVLNLFSYSGAHGIAALKGGALSVHHIDESADALELCRVHTEMNGFDTTVTTTEQADIFSWLGETREQAADDRSYDMIILDPPALIKSRKDAEMGRKAYHFINRAALRMAKPGTIFITSSCSHYMNEEDFGFLLRRASVQAGRELSVLEIIRQAPDHPESIYFPEASYLKTFVCVVGV